MRAALVQFDVRRGDVAHNVERAEELLREARSSGAELAVLPEMWPTSFPDAGDDLELAVADSARALQRMAELSADLGLAIAGSAFGAASAGELPRNRLHVLVAGRLALAYDKVHLFSPTAEVESFSAGSEPPAVVHTRLAKLSGVVCYDLRFPELWRRPFLAGAELLVVPAQWPSPRATQFRALALGVAAANQCFVLAANRTGVDRIGRRALELEFPGNSIAAGPRGEALAEGHGEEGVVIADLDLEAARELRVRVPVLKDRRPDVYI